MMPATPDAFLITRITWLATFLRALAVLAVVAAVFLAWRAVFGARLAAAVTTEESAITIGFTWYMNSTTEATKAVTYNINRDLGTT